MDGMISQPDVVLASDLSLREAETRGSWVLRLAWDYGKIMSQKKSKPTIKTTVCVCVGEIWPCHRVGVQELELTAQGLSPEPRSTLTLFAQKDSL